MAAAVENCDIAIVGAGAAGLATAIFAARENPAARILLLDGAAHIGAKILVSGGGRCNVTNVRVSAADYSGGSRRIIQRVLDAFSVEDARQFFRELGVELRLEETGKYFPVANRARAVLQGLLDGLRVGAVELRNGSKVMAVAAVADGFRLKLAGRGSADESAVNTRAVVLATGGLSLPKSGSDGSGFGLVQALGHTQVPCTPALVPLLLDGEWYAALSGVSHPVELTCRRSDAKPVRVVGSLLWTHFGISGPAALDVSRNWLRGRLEGAETTLILNSLPGCDRATLDQKLQTLAQAQPRATLRSFFAEELPGRVVEVLLARAAVQAETPLAHLSRGQRRAAAGALTELELPVTGSRGYGYAEVTAGGVPLTEVDAATMESRRCPGLFLVGEILDVDGRIGGFNFQWAWSSAFVAARGIQQRLAGERPQ